MDFGQLAKERYSVRSFDGQKVPSEYIEKIVQAGLCCPTAHNNQPQKIIVVNSTEGLKKFRRCTECHYNAPLGFVICYDKTLCWKRSYDGKLSGEVDASIVTTHMCLQATDLGLGSTWIMYFIPEAVTEEFDLPDNIVPVALLVVGYPSKDSSPSPSHFNKKDPDKIVEYR